MKDRRPYRKEGPQRRGIKVTDISEKQALINRIKKDRRRLSFLTVLVPLAFIFLAVGALGDGPGRQISAYVVGDIATLESIGSDTNDVLLFEVDMSDGSLRVSHTDPGGRGSEVTLRLERVVVTDNHGGTNDNIGTYQIADASYSTKTYNVVLDEVDGQVLEVEWHLVGESKLELHLELFDEKLVHDGVEYGPASALMRFELNYPEEGFNLEISLEVEVLTSQEDLSWQDRNNFVEISSSLPSSVMTIGLDKEIHHEQETEDVSFSHENIGGGIAFTSDFPRLKEFSWEGFLNVDILPFEEEDWHPSVDTVSFGVTVFFSAAVVILLKSRYSRS